MKPEDLKGLFSVLEMMVQVELQVADLYGACAEVWKEDQDFWLALEKQEHQHAINIRKMAEIIRKKGQLFERYRPFNIIGLQTIISGINDNIRSLKSGDLSKKESFFVALNLEKSLIEAKYDEIVRTNDLEYGNLVGEIVSQNLQHRKLMEAKIEEMKTAG